MMCTSRSLIFALVALGIHYDGRADVFYVAQGSQNKIARISAGGIAKPFVTSGLASPQAVAFDTAGDLYVADAGSNRVLRIPGGTGLPVQVGNNVAAVACVAFDANGVLHASSPTDRAIRRLSQGSFVDVISYSAGTTPRGFAFGPDGHIFVADNTGNRVLEVTPQGGSSTFSDDVTAPFGVAFDSTGKLHVSDTQSGGRIVNFNPNGKARAVASSLGAVRGISFDSVGDLYFTTGTGSLQKITGNSSTEVAGQLGDPAFFAARSATTRVAAFKGQTLADPKGAQLATLGSPAIGGVFAAFRGTLKPGVSGVATSNAVGIWRSDATGTLELIARQSFGAPGVSNAVFQTLGDPILDESGRIAFLGAMRPGLGGITAATSAGVWADASGTLSLIAQKGKQAPGLDQGVNFTAFQQLVLGNDAGPALLATVAGPGINGSNNLGLWSADLAGNLALVIRKGDVFDVSGKSRKLASLTIFKPSPTSLGQARNLSSNRQFAFLAKFTDGWQAIVKAQSGQNPVVLAAKADPATGDIPSASLLGLGQPCSADDASALSFLSKLTPGSGDVTAGNNIAILRQDATRELIARKTFPAPGVASSAFASVGEPVENGSGDVAFLGKLKPGLGGVTSSTAAGLWSDVSGTLAPMVRQGDPVLNVKGSVAFKQFKQFVLPDNSGPLFTAVIAGNGITSANNLGLWASDGAGGNELLIRKGDKREIDGSSRTIAAFTIFKVLKSVSGQGRWHNSGGDAACLVKCTDGTQAILVFGQP